MTRISFQSTYYQSRNGNDAPHSYIFYFMRLQNTKICFGNILLKKSNFDVRQEQFCRFSVDIRRVTEENHNEMCHSRSKRQM